MDEIAEAIHSGAKGYYRNIHGRQRKGIIDKELEIATQSVTEVSQAMRAGKINPDKAAKKYKELAGKVRWAKNIAENLTDDEMKEQFEPTIKKADEILARLNPHQENEDNVLDATSRGTTVANKIKTTNPAQQPQQAA